MKKRLTALSLCCALLISVLLPRTVLAENIDEQQDVPPEIISIKLDKNKQTLSPEEQVKISIEVLEGEESAGQLAALHVELGCEGEETRVVTLDKECFRTNLGQYEVLVPASETIGDVGQVEKQKDQKWFISSITIKDQAGGEGKLAKDELMEESIEGELEYKYWYIAKAESEGSKKQTELSEDSNLQPAEESEDVQRTETKEEIFKAAQASPVGKCRIELNYRSTNEAGRLREERIIKYVNQGTKIGEVLTEAKKREAPDSNYNGMTFQKWVGASYYEENGNTEISDGQIVGIGAQYDKILISCDYAYMSESGKTEIENRKELVDSNMDIQAVYDKLRVYSNKKPLYRGLKVESWTLSLSEPEKQYTGPVKNYAPAGFYTKNCSACCNKGVVVVSYGIYDKKGEAKNLEKVFLVDKNITYKEVKTLCYVNAPKAECTNPTRTGWTCPFMESQADNKFFEFYNSYSRYVLMSEAYNNYVDVSFYYDSINEEGGSDLVAVGKLYPIGTPYTEVVKDGMASAIKPEYDGFRFKGWKCSNMEQLPETVEEGSIPPSVHFEPGAENCLVQYTIYDPLTSGRESKMVSAFIVEKGTTIVPPKDIAGHKNIQWWDMESYKVVVRDAVNDFWGEEGVQDYTKENIDILDPNTVIYLPQNTSNTLIQQIQSSSPGQTIETSFGNATILSQDILKAMKGKDTTVKLSMENGITWSVDGRSVREDDIKDTNLLVQKYDKDKGPIPTITMNRTAGELPANQLSLVHEGAFGFNAQLSFATDESLNGKKGILLWHNNGTMQLEDSAIVKGNIAGFDFVHGSEYAVVYAMNGDVDNDSKISIRDMMRILHHISSYNTLNALQQGIADVDMNNKVNIQDMMRILHVLSGHSSEL